MSTDINCLNSSRMMPMHSCRAIMSSMAWRIARNTVFTLLVCGELFSSVYPCEMSETAMKAAADCMDCKASSKPSSPNTRQKTKLLAFANVFEDASRSKNAVLDKCISERKISVFYFVFYFVCSIFA